MPEGKARFEGWGGRSVRNLLAAIEKSKAVGLRRAMVGWSIPLTSEGTAKRICRHGYDSIEQLQAATVEELCQVEDVGPVVAQALREFLDQPATQAEIAALRELGVSLDVREDRPIQAPTDSPFAGKTVVITGALSVDRKEFQALVEAAGAKACVGQNRLPRRGRLRRLEAGEGKRTGDRRSHRGPGAGNAGRLDLAARVGYEQAVIVGSGQPPGG